MLDQLNLIEAAPSAQCVIVICKHAGVDEMSRRLSARYNYNTATKAAVLTEALEGRMRRVDMELKDTKAQLEKIPEAPMVMHDNDLQKPEEDVEVKVRKSFVNTMRT